MSKEVWREWLLPVGCDGGRGGEEEGTPPRKLQCLNYQRVIGGTSRPARKGWWWSCSTLPNSNLKPKELKGKEKSWQEEPGEMEEQRWRKRRRGEGQKSG